MLSHHVPEKLLHPADFLMSENLKLQLYFWLLQRADDEDSYCNWIINLHINTYTQFLISLCEASTVHIIL